MGWKGFSGLVSKGKSNLANKSVNIKKSIGKTGSNNSIIGGKLKANIDKIRSTTKSKHNQYKNWQSEKSDEWNKFISDGIRPNKPVRKGIPKKQVKFSSQQLPDELEEVPMNEELLTKGGSPITMYLIIGAVGIGAYMYFKK